MIMPTERDAGVYHTFNLAQEQKIEIPK